MASRFKNHLTLAHDYWSQAISKGDCAIDATAGNGHDSLFLAHLALEESRGELHVIDILPEAIQNTKKRLEEALPQKISKRVSYYIQSHTHLPSCTPKLIVYNLGYLPGGDKTQTTQVASTLASIQQGLDILMPSGILSITCYPGHPEGALEENALIAFSRKLDRKSHDVLYFQNLNREKAPSLLIIKKCLPI